MRKHKASTTKPGNVNGMTLLLMYTSTVEHHQECCHDRWVPISTPFSTRSTSCCDPSQETTLLSAESSRSESTRFSCHISLPLISLGLLFTGKVMHSTPCANIVHCFQFRHHIVSHEKNESCFSILSHFSLIRKPMKQSKQLSKLLMTIH